MSTPADAARQLRHDLKTPLTALIGFLELIEERQSVATDPVAVDYLARCDSAAKRVLALIDEQLADGGVLAGGGSSGSGTGGEGGAGGSAGGGRAGRGSDARDH
jgi:uncharacterized membrane protein YgcG